MRLTQEQVQIIKAQAETIFGKAARVTLFGSRADQQGKGGDIDIMITTDQPVDRPALLAARLSARISLAMEGQQVDVVLNAPSLKRLSVHDMAEQTGVQL